MSHLLDFVLLISGTGQPQRRPLTITRGTTLAPGDHGPITVPLGPHVPDGHSWFRSRGPAPPTRRTRCRTLPPTPGGDGTLPRYRTKPVSLHELVMDKAVRPTSA
ncbi:hypothetical protein GCM10022214_00770 [Actinomadura miaoliensis]|uniref:Uncharacterized protein n=1 Tax=Actinomadura miaoliensis TaxID=430685 RepID=A0ABP7UWR9_9ACTN